MLDSSALCVNLSGWISRGSIQTTSERVSRILGSVLSIILERLTVGFSEWMSRALLVGFLLVLRAWWYWIEYSRPWYSSRLVLTSLVEGRISYTRCSSRFGTSAFPGQAVLKTGPRASITYGIRMFDFVTFTSANRPSSRAYIHSNREIYTYILNLTLAT